MHGVRILVLVAATLALLLVPAVASFAHSTGAGKQDFGDAPDGRATGYGPRAKFPSLRKSDGARAADSSTTFLGKRANRESNARLVDRDRFDDGVSVRLNSRAKSEALVVVNRPDFDVPTESKAYLNLFFDWDQDDMWAGKQRRCGKKKPVEEWTVKNFEIDLAAQTTRQALYRVKFRAGRVPGAMWLRAILTIDEPWQESSGAGAFPFGEVEDYLLGDPRARALTCAPRGFDHGNAAVFRIVRAPGTRPILSSRLAAATGGVNAAGSKATNKTRTIARLSSSRYRYRSKEVHFLPLPGLVRETFRVSVTVGTPANKRTVVVKCKATVFHGPESDIDDSDGDDPGGGVGGEFVLTTNLSHHPITGSGADSKAVLCIDIDTNPAQKSKAYEVFITDAGTGTVLPTISGKLDANGKASLRPEVSAGSTPLGVTYAVQVRMAEGIGFTFTQGFVEVVPGFGVCTT